MNCPECGGQTRVVKPFHTTKNQTLRWRACANCGHRFYTLETEIEKTGTVPYMINEARSLQRRMGAGHYGKRLEAFESIGMEPEELKAAAELYRRHVLKGD